MIAPWMFERYTFEVRKPKAPEGGSDVTVRESPDELTPLKDVNHIEPER